MDSLIAIPQLQSVAVYLSNPAWDVVALLAFGVLGFIYGVMSGRGRLVAMLFGLYVAKLLFDNAWFLDKFIGAFPPFQQFFANVGIIAALTFIFSYIFAKCFSGRVLVGERWWQIFLLSFLEVGLAASIIFSVLPSIEPYTFSPLVKTLFASPNVLFWWLLLPAVALFFILG